MTNLIVRLEYQFIDNIFILCIFTGELNHLFALVGFDLASGL